MSKHFYRIKKGWGGSCNSPYPIWYKEHYCNKCDSVAKVSDIKILTHYFSTFRGDASEDEQTATITCEKCGIVEKNVTIDWGDTVDRTYYSAEERRAFRNYD